MNKEDKTLLLAIGLCLLTYLTIGIIKWYF